MYKMYRIHNFRGNLLWHLPYSSRSILETTRHGGEFEQRSSEQGSTAAAAVDIACDFTHTPGVRSAAGEDMSWKTTKDPGDNTHKRNFKLHHKPSGLDLQIFCRDLQAERLPRVMSSWAKTHSRGAGIKRQRCCLDTFFFATCRLPSPAGLYLSFPLPSTWDVS